MESSPSDLPVETPAESGDQKEQAPFIQYIPIHRLRVSDQNVRRTNEKTTCETNLNTLTANIKQYGLLNPLTVRQMAHPPNSDSTDENHDNTYYEVLAGQRRLRALQNLNWSSVPCRVLPCKDDETASMISFAENIQRLPMTMHDKCVYIYKLYKLHNENLKVVSKLTNLSVLTLKRYLNLSQNLSASLHDRLEEKGEDHLTIGVADLLTKAVPNAEKQEEVLDMLGDLKSNREKREVLQSMIEDPQTNLEDVIQDTQKKSDMKKRNTRIKRNPWVFDNDQNPVPIPKRLHGTVYDLICKNGGM